MNTPRDHGLRLMIILSALMSFSSIATDMYLPALPTLVHDLHTDMGRVALTISTFLTGFSLGQLLWGPISDRIGRRGPIAAGLLLFAVGSVGCAVAADINQLLFWRAVQALGACAGPVLARAMVRDLYAWERSAQILSLLILMMAVAPLAGPLLGGQILKFWSWRAIFGVLAACGVLALFALKLLPETLPPTRRNRAPLRHTLAEYLQLIRDPRLLTYALAGGFYYGGCYAFIAGTPFAYVDYYHVSPTVFGLLFSVNIVGLMAVNFLNTRLIARMGSERLFQLGAVMVAVAGVVLIFTAKTGFGDVAGLAVPVFFFMAPSGFIVANSVAGALSLFERQAGAASSLIGAVHYGSGVFTAAMLGWFADGTPWPMGLIVGLAGVGCLVVALLPRLSLVARPVRT
ncbi:Bcr/CflA family multidrug efflux MFS transporter [Silvimonas iriomotensis]|uniref:Bcr/CflA family efflux transporter n=1 Tax=Silvimonas iriomotensis TaxID=449662 RepID=A0ABQ2P9I9_9NEIS|nr:Bcr/CflA family multidrug efflux MFS transporter [Silvimonas iriomotensis]GGP21537.1 Bcr/CflA family drug resistance efflux transporter [Silvimonas iriomotensis]